MFRFPAAFARAEVRSGWDEVIGGLETYISGLPKKTKTTLLAFDTAHDFAWEDQVGIDVKAALSEGKIVPRGMTALFDAIGRMASVVKTTAGKKAQIVIITDGQENASQEVWHGAVKAIIDEWKANDFDVVFLGADFDAFGQAASIGIAAAQTVNYASNKSGLMGEALSSRAASYASGTTGANATWSDKDRARVK